MSTLKILSPNEGPQADSDDFLGQPRDISSHEFLNALIEDRQEDVAKMIVQDDRLVKSRDAAGASAILLAVYHGLDEILGILRRSEVQLDLAEASAVGDLERVRELTASRECDLEETSGDGFPPLVLAATYGREEVLAHLLESGADATVTAINPTRTSALHGASAYADIERARVMAEALLAAGGDPNAEQAGGFRPLHQAASKGHGPVIRLLLEAGADASAESDLGVTPGELASDRGHIAAMALLS